MPGNLSLSFDYAAFQSKVPGNLSYYPRIYAEEERLRVEAEEIVKLNNRLSIWFPTTFLNLTEAEVSSLGLENALLFEGYAQEGQKKFSRFVESAYPAQDVYECNGWAEEVKAHRFLLEKKV